MKIALTIAGSDPTGGAGLQADIKTFRALGVYGVSAPAALTAQSTTGIDRIFAVPGDFFERQLSCLLDDIRPDALKTGMLYSVSAVRAVAESIGGYGLENLVVDPVAVSSSGSKLVEDGTLEAIKDLLFPLATCVTPNIYEASILTGINIETPEEMEEAAKALRGIGPETVVITGGHIDGALTTEIFFDGKGFEKIEGRRLEGEFHGTGCAFSAAVAAYLALGKSPLDAVRGARNFVQSAMLKAHRPGKGMDVLNL